jgi:hypothetical protein
VFFAAIFVTFNALTAQAQGSTTAYWTTAGSAGATEDESNPAGGITYTNFAASVNAGAPLGTYILRYNIVAVDGLFNPGDGLLLVRYRDNGPNSRVLVEIRRSNQVTGGNEVVGTFDSDLLPQVMAFQTSAFNYIHTFDFDNWVYWLEVTMTRTADDGIPSFALAKVRKNP